MAKAATQLVNFILLPVYTAVLSTAEYGEIDLYTTAAMIVLPFLTLQIEQAVFRYLVGVSDFDERMKVITSGFVALFVAVALVTLAYIPLAVWLHLTNSVLVYFYYVAQAVVAVLLQTCRGFSDNVGYSVGSFLASALAVLANILFVAVLSWGVSGALLATVVANILAGIYLCWRTKIWSYLKAAAFSKDELKRMLAYSSPLIFNQVSSWAVNYSNRVILLAFMGIGANGVYAVACKFSNAVGTVYGVYNLAWTENMVLNSEDKDYREYVSRMTTMTMRGYLAMVIVVLALLPILFPYLVNESYWDAYMQVPLTTLGIFFSGMAATLGSIYIVYGKTVSVAVTTCLAGVACILLNLLTVQMFGLYSSSGSYLVAFSLMFIYRYFKMRSFHPVKINWKSLLPDFVFCALICVLYYLHLNILSLVAGFIVGVYECWLLKRNGLFGVICSKLRKKKGN